MNHDEFELNQEGKGLDIRKIVMKALALWPWMLFCALITVSVAAAYLYFAQPVYKVNASVLIKDEDKKLGGGSEMEMLQNIGLMGGASNVDNELEIIKSYTLMFQVVKALDLNVGYYRRTRFKDVPVYGADVPFDVNTISTNEDTLKEGAMSYKVSFGKNGNYVLEDEDKHLYKGRSNDTLQLPAGKIVLTGKGTPNEIGDNEYVFKLSNKDQVTTTYMKNLTSEIPNKQVSVINLSLESGLPSKGQDVVNKLIEIYMKANVDDNNRIADSTVAFIDVRLLTIGEELTNIEKDIQVFKQRNELADISEQARVLIGNTGEYAKNLAQQEVQLSVIESLEAHLKASADNPRIVPASLMLENASLTALTTQYNGLLMERQRLMLSSTDDNPRVKNLDAQLLNLRGDLVNNLASIRNSMQVVVNELRRKSGNMESQIRAVPAQEREFLDYSRQQAIKQELYLFLLQKREEAAISKSSTIANARVIDSAKADTWPFKPKKMLILAAGALLGILIPFGFVYGKEMLNTRISNKEDIEKGTQVPIIAEIGHNEGGNGGIVVTRASRSPVSEQFRMLRTNLQYLFTKADDKVVMLTSSMPGEGKSFVSSNLAAILALSGKKVALLELDLRKPRISAAMDIKGNPGFSAYAIGQASLEDILVPVKAYPGLWVMPSGPIPPNPAELLLLDRTKEMFADLREAFDYIIVDTTPNLVTDAQLLSRYADATLYLVRVGVTFKDQLKLPDALSKEKRMPKVNLVVNDVNYKKYGGYYGYGGYGYGYGYYSEELAPQKKWQFWKRKGEPVG